MTVSLLLILSTYSLLYTLSLCLVSFLLSQSPNPLTILFCTIPIIQSSLSHSVPLSLCLKLIFAADLLTSDPLIFRSSDFRSFHHSLFTIHAFHPSPLLFILFPGFFPAPPYFPFDFVDKRFTAAGVGKIRIKILFTHYCIN